MHIKTLIPLLILLYATILWTIKTHFYICNLNPLKKNIKLYLLKFLSCYRSNPFYD